jgi:hypothetical protein
MPVEEETNGPGPLIGRAQHRHRTLIRGQHDLIAGRQPFDNLGEMLLGLLDGDRPQILLH